MSKTTKVLIAIGIIICVYTKNIYDLLGFIAFILLFESKKID